MFCYYLSLVLIKPLLDNYRPDLDNEFLDIECLDFDLSLDNAPLMLDLLVSTILHIFLIFYENSLKVKLAF